MLQDLNIQLPQNLVDNILSNLEYMSWENNSTVWYYNDYIKYFDNDCTFKYSASMMDDIIFKFMQDNINYKFQNMRIDYLSGYGLNTPREMDKTTTKFHTDDLKSDYAICVNITNDDKSCTEYIDWGADDMALKFGVSEVNKQSLIKISDGENTVKHLKRNTFYKFDRRFIHRVASHSAPRIFIRIWGVKPA